MAKKREGEMASLPDGANIVYITGIGIFKSPLIPPGIGVFKDGNFTLGEMATDFIRDHKLKTGQNTPISITKCYHSDGSQ